MEDTISGKLLYREDIPVVEPDLRMAVARLPQEFAEARKHG
jgi:hypothetical protein